MFWIKRSWYPVSNLDVGILISWDKKRDSIYYIIYVLCVEKGRSRWAPTIQFRKRKYHTTAGPFPLESIFQHLKEYTRKAQHSKGYLGFLVAFAFDPILLLNKRPFWAKICTVGFLQPKFTPPFWSKNFRGFFLQLPALPTFSPRIGLFFPVQSSITDLQPPLLPTNPTVHLNCQVS